MEGVQETEMKMTMQDGTVVEGTTEECANFLLAYYRAMMGKQFEEILKQVRG